MTGRNYHKVFQRMCLICGCLQLIFGLGSIVTGLLNTGSVFLSLGGILFTAAGLWLWEDTSNPLAQLSAVMRRTVRVTRGKVIMLKILFFILLAVLAGHAILWNYYAYGRRPASAGPATVVVLGCQIRGDQPSVMLRRRLERALSYLQLNPEADCVASGGIGEGEKYSEAYVMQKYLTEHGIEPERIYLEEESVNTETNLSNSIRLIREKGLSENLIVCSDGFHQLRAYLYARRSGISPKAISGKTTIWVVPSYAVRELCGVLKMLVFG